MGPAAALPMAAQIGIPVASSVLGGIGGKRGAKAANQPTSFSQTQQVTPMDFNYAYGGDRGGTGGQQVLGDLVNAWVGMLGQQAQNNWLSPRGQELWQGGMQDWRQGRAS